MQPSKTKERALDKQRDEICDSLHATADREVETLQQNGVPIHVSGNDRIVDLQEHKRPRQSNPTPLSFCHPRPHQTICRSAV